jgi:hypothetical protein
MRKISTILILVIIYLTCGSQGCNQEADRLEFREEKLLAAVRDSIKQESEISSPDERLLSIYEATARQKLADLAEYLKIASDTLIDTTFRAQAGEMARKIFISGKAEIPDLLNSPVKSVAANIDDLIKNCLSDKTDHWIQPLYITSKEKFTQRNDTLFTGKLSFRYKSIPFLNSSHQDSTPRNILVDTYAIKKAKLFGKDTLTIWEVSLGDIRNY